MYRITAILDSKADIELGFFPSREVAFNKIASIFVDGYFVVDSVVYPVHRVHKFLVGM
jgi:hypothetical protein